MGTIDDTRNDLTCGTCKYAVRLDKGGAVSLITLECSNTEQPERYRIIWEVCEYYER